MMTYLLYYEYTQSDTYMLVLTYKCIYSFEKALYKFEPYILSLIDKKVLFLSIILVEILNVFKITTQVKICLSLCTPWRHAGGSNCIPAFIPNLRTTWRPLIRLTPPPLYSRKKNSRFPVNRKFDVHQRRSGGFGEMCVIVIQCFFSVGHSTLLNMMGRNLKWFWRIENLLYYRYT